jgi:ribonuclease P protein component
LSRSYFKGGSRNQVVGRESDEENVPTKPQAQEPNSRIPGEDALESRACDPLSAPAKGTASAGGVSPAYQRLKASERLEKKAEFQKVYKRGRRLSSRFFIAYVLCRPVGPLRVGVVASRRVGRAVVRNRAKRLLREVFRKNRPERSVSADVVLIARPSIAEARYHDIEKAYVLDVYSVIEAAGEGSR